MTRLLGKPKFCCRVHSILTLIHILSQINPIRNILLAIFLY